MTLQTHCILYIYLLLYFMTLLKMISTNLVINQTGGIPFDDDPVGRTIYFHLWLYSLLDPGRFIRFSILYTVGRTPWTGDQSVKRPLPTHSTKQADKKRTQTHMPRVRFEPTIPVFERAKTVHAFGRAGTVIGEAQLCSTLKIVVLYFYSKIHI
jgi:hypothetical protein